jgi:hypothetical protein
MRTWEFITTAFRPAGKPHHYKPLAIHASGETVEAAHEKAKAHIPDGERLFMIWELTQELKEIRALLKTGVDHIVVAE